jgi:hypothetical protein
MTHGARAHIKPGYVPGDACVDIALITDSSGSGRYLLAVDTSADGWKCPTVDDVDTAPLRFLVGTSRR